MLKFLLRYLIAWGVMSPSLGVFLGFKLWQTGIISVICLMGYDFLKLFTKGLIRFNKLGQISNSDWFAGILILWLFAFGWIVGVVFGSHYVVYRYPIEHLARLVATNRLDLTAYINFILYCSVVVAISVYQLTKLRLEIEEKVKAAKAKPEQDIMDIPPRPRKPRKSRGGL